MIAIVKRYPLASYFILAFLITWGFQLAAIGLAVDLSMTLSNEANFRSFVDLIRLRLPGDQLAIYLLFTLGAGPLLSAILVTALTEGRAGLRSLWADCRRWRIGGRWYLLALAIPLGLSLASLAIGLLASGGALSLDFKLPLAAFVAFFLYMLVFTGIVEEPGWRGYALPRLQRRYNAERSSWILGVLWGVWHFPFIIYYNAGAGVGPMLASLVGLILGTVGWTIVNTWLYNNTRSVWLMIVLHGWGNAVQSYLVLSTGNMAAQTAYGVLPWAIALVLLRRYGAENLAPHERPQA